MQPTTESMKYERVVTTGIVTSTTGQRIGVGKVLGPTHRKLDIPVGHTTGRYHGENTRRGQHSPPKQIGIARAL